MLRRIMLAVVTVSCCVALSRAHAEIRTCAPLIQSDVVVAATELDGKKQALEQWRQKAAKFGLGYDGWHVAAEKALKCFSKDGGFECMAVGHPCVIQHNPNQRPAGADRKGQPL